MSASHAKQYGGSESFLNYVLTHQLEELQPRQIVDFGAGGGKNGHIARKLLNGHVELIAIEGSEKTAKMLSAQNLYNEVHHSLIEEWVCKDIRKFDLAIFGDVLEHLTAKQIHNVIGHCLKKFTHIIIVCPLHDIFQEEMYGNSLEVHRAYITSNFFKRYNIIEKHIFRGKVWTIMNVRILSERDPEPIWRRLSWILFHNTMLILQPFGLARPFVNVLKRHFLKYKWLLRG